MNILPATAEDARAIAEIHVRAWQHAYSAIFPREALASLSVEKREHLWQQSIAARSPDVLVALADNKAAGFIAFGPLRQENASADQAEIWVINIDPPFWSQGIGTALMLAARQTLTGQGYRSVCLWVLQENSRARRFYEALGMKLHPQSRKEFVYEGTSVSEVLYCWHTDG